jgi:tripartite-type tricarboxylate transporter receptor subunit TctC
MHRALALLLLLFVSPTSAQTYPARLVEVVVPFAAGGGTDLIETERLSAVIRRANIHLD